MRYKSAYLFQLLRFVLNSRKRITNIALVKSLSKRNLCLPVFCLLTTYIYRRTGNLGFSNKIAFLIDFFEIAKYCIVISTIMYQYFRHLQLCSCHYRAYELPQYGGKFYGYRRSGGTSINVSLFSGNNSRR